jgi:hypothetical protein
MKIQNLESYTPMQQDKLGFAVKQLERLGSELLLL